MKNKRILAVMVLLILVLLLGIGYAVTEKSLIISGSASALAEDNNFTVRFKKTGDSYDAPTNLVNAEAGDRVFENDTSLVGGSGDNETKFTSSQVSKTYARISTADTPGYFTNVNEKK